MEINKTQNSNIKSKIIEGIGYAAGTAIAFNPVYRRFAENTQPVSPSKIRNMASYCKKIMPDIDSFEKIKKVANATMEKSGLMAKGVELNFINDENINKVKETFYQRAKIKNPFKKIAISRLFEIFKEGGNAAFIPKAKAIYAGEKSLYSCIFHEIGHAHNKYKSSIGKILQTTRYLLTPIGMPIAGLVLFTIGLFHSPKEQNTKQTGWDKVKEFGRNHAGKIAFLTSLPIILEEAIASKKGINFAKEFFKPEQIQQLTKNYKFALNTYVKSALKFSVAIGLGNIIIDFAQKQKTQKA